MNLETLAPTLLAPPPPRVKISFEEFLQMDGEGMAEWVDGEVIFMLPASKPHQDLTLFLSNALNIFVQQHRLGTVMIAPFPMKLEMRPAGREPDLLFIKAENLSRLTRQYLDGPADLAVEVISPESRSRDRGDKFDEYEQAGVPEYWVLDKDRERAGFYVLAADGIYDLVRPGPDGIYHSTALPGLWLRVEWLWQEPLPNIMVVLQEWGLV